MKSHDASLHQPLSLPMTDIVIIGTQTGSDGEIKVVCGVKRVGGRGWMSETDGEPTQEKEEGRGRKRGESKREREMKKRDMT